MEAQPLCAISHRGLNSPRPLGSLPLTLLLYVLANLPAFNARVIACIYLDGEAEWYDKRGGDVDANRSISR